MRFVIRPSLHALFDERTPLLQSPRTMRALRIWLCLAGATVSELAQTNAPEPREMSLEGCIEIGLHHNLDVQIKRLSPELSRFTLEGAYGAYAPAVCGGAEHDFNRQPGSVDVNARAIPVE